jgi:probable F420-dependent oxidoreductase
VIAHGYDGLWTAETQHDPFLPLVLAAEHSESLELGTGIAVAFARNPMTLAHLAWDLQGYSSGRFILGLGSQIKAHIRLRFSMQWSKPAARMRELILAIRAIWLAWAEGTPLDFTGEFYTHILMTPFFDPGPQPYGNPPIYLAAVGPHMTRVAGEVADGLLAHGFTTESYFRNVTRPTLADGAARAGRTLDDIVVSLPVFVVTGKDEEEMAASRLAVQQQIAFYGSTPAYRGVLEHHGWGDLQTELTRMSKQGSWEEMAALIDDPMLNTFAVVGTPEEVGSGIYERYGDVADRVSFYTMPQGHDDAVMQQMITSLRSAAG